MPAASMRSRMWSISASVTLGWVMMIMGSGSGWEREGANEKRPVESTGRWGWFARVLVSLSRSLPTTARGAGREGVGRRIGASEAHGGQVRTRTGNGNGKGGRRGRSTWPNYVAELRGRTTWPNYVAELRGRTTWPNYVAELRGRTTWPNYV